MRIGLDPQGQEYVAVAMEADVIIVPAINAACPANDAGVAPLQADVPFVNL